MSSRRWTVSLALSLGLLVTPLVWADEAPSPTPLPDATPAYEASPTAKATPEFGQLAQQNRTTSQTSTHATRNSTTTYIVKNGIATIYTSIGGEKSKIGRPVSNEYRWRGGWRQDFYSGSIVWTPSNAGYTLQGAIGAAYFPRSKELGWPVSNEKETGSGWAQSFENGDLYWSAQGGAHVVKNGMAKVYARFGGQLDMPTGDEYCIGAGWRQDFSGGIATWTPAGNGYAVKGAIGGNYRRSGAVDAFGWPTSDDKLVGNTWVQTFERANLYWSAGRGNYALKNGMYLGYSWLSPNKLGIATGNEYAWHGQIRQDFENGTMLWTPNNVAYSLTGAIGWHYLNKGGPTTFGWPVGHEYQAGAGYRQRFDDADIYWSNWTGTYTTRGAIRTYYNSQGGASSWLGFPTTDESYANGIWTQRFQHGTVTYSSRYGINSGGSVAPRNNSREERFIAKVAPMAMRTQEVYSVPASVTIAQAILESGWGGSTLSTDNNAYFGIKCTRDNGPYANGCAYYNTWEVINGRSVTVKAGFRTYPSLTNSVLDHGNFLRVNSRYAPAFRTNSADEFARAIHRAGYATDPGYSNKLIWFMDTYDLRRFDR